MGRSKAFSRSSLAVCSAVGALLCACGESGPALRRGGPNTSMVIEVGPGGRPLADLLARDVPADATVVPDVVARPTADLVTEGPARERRTVRLRAGQTLSQLCAEQLGDAGRWREVAELNGWTEGQLNALSANSLVRLPPF